MKFFCKNNNSLTIFVKMLHQTQMSSRYASDLLTWAYLEPSWISMMELLSKNIEELKNVNYFCKNARP